MSIYHIYRECLIRKIIVLNHQVIVDEAKEVCIRSFFFTMSSTYSAYLWRKVIVPLRRAISVATYHEHASTLTRPRCRNAWRAKAEGGENESTVNYNSVHLITHHALVFCKAR